MNAVEIEEAVSQLSLEEYCKEEFYFKFLAAFGNKATTIKKLRKGETNKSDINGLLLKRNIHIKTCSPGATQGTLDELKNSNATQKWKLNSSWQQMAKSLRQKT